MNEASKIEITKSFLKEENVNEISKFQKEFLINK